jgi:translation initiation factor 1
VYGERRKFGKIVTIVEGIDDKQLSIKEVAKRLKSKLACGGTAKEGRIELQGDHKARAKEVLMEMGFSPDMIDVK